MDFKNDKIIFTSSEDGEFDICVKYSDVTSNTVTLKFEDKEAIEQARIAAEQARIAQEQNQQAAPVEGMVWLSATGSKYHNKPNCGNMNPNNARRCLYQKHRGTMIHVKIVTDNIYRGFTGKKKVAF